MKTKTTIFILLLLFFLSHSPAKREVTRLPSRKIEVKSKDETAEEKNNSMRMYQVLEKYSNEYSIPKHIIYNIAFIETKYKGPFDSQYRHNLGSPSGALGPMQVMPSTANLIHKKRVSTKQLRNDIDFNVLTSAKLLSLLFDKYKNWGLVCGAYNTGRPIINKYSKFCTGNVFYWNNWTYNEEVSKYYEKTSSEN